MESRSTKNTAARLDRFEKADRWGQRRVEEGFAVNAACMAESNRAIRAWNILTEKFNDVERRIYEGALQNLKDLDFPEKPARKNPKPVLWKEYAAYIGFGLFCFFSSYLVIQAAASILIKYKQWIFTF